VEEKRIFYQKYNTPAAENILCLLALVNSLNSFPIYSWLTEKAIGMEIKIPFRRSD